MLLGGVDLSMSAAVQPIATLPTLPSSGPPPHNPLHHTPGGLALPPVMMPRPPATAIPSLGPSLPPSHQDAADLAEAAPNQDVLLALLARNKNLEGKHSFHPFFLFFLFFFFLFFAPREELRSPVVSRSTFDSTDSLLCSSCRPRVEPILRTTISAALWFSGMSANFFI